MGQVLSEEEKPAPLSHEELVKELANIFADKCFTSLELYSLKQVFKSLAHHEQRVGYLKEGTIATYLNVPDILGVSPVLFQMVTYIAAFPFLEDAPAFLGLQQMVIVITLMTDRYRRVLRKDAADKTKLLFKSLAVYDRKLSRPAADMHSGLTNAREQAENDRQALDNDELVLAAFDALGHVIPDKQQNMLATHEAMIPGDNFRKFIMLLLLVAPLDPQGRLDSDPNRVTGAGLQCLRTAAESILAAFLDVEQKPGVEYLRFSKVIASCLPFLFRGLTPLFEHFLFSEELDFHKGKEGTSRSPTMFPKPEQPILQDAGSIMNASILSQISFFLPGNLLFRRLRLLYAGDEDGFSMGSFEAKVFKWKAPTILLVCGTRLRDDSDHHSNGSAPAFWASLPPRRFPRGSSGDAERLTFGVYVPEPWKLTHRECFGGEDTILFQLEPIHDLFRASSLNKDHISFARPSASPSHAGVSFGCPPPRPSQVYHRSSIIALGPVSLMLDSCFEFGCFTHDYASKGGAFHTSMIREYDFQERFEIGSVEVWGCGGDEEAKDQAERWAWEAREAEARRRINLGTGDIEADRALLEMAGLVGSNRNGGSMA
ncbi:TLD-domain-containing protein [Neurospora hispaniola]|uniref:Restriction of telomere capping protein 5 n=1 Tax=Neurospora hispaniola TaxID=588809 RepID=A0AAJ0I021_9PEZI|nr:TLD-domain-containing protein [Neurospora hispaniola]